MVRTNTFHMGDEKGGRGRGRGRGGGLSDVTGDSASRGRGPGGGAGTSSSTGERRVSLRNQSVSVSSRQRNVTNTSKRSTSVTTRSTEQNHLDSDVEMTSGNNNAESPDFNISVYPQSSTVRKVVNIINATTLVQPASMTQMQVRTFGANLLHQATQGIFPEVDFDLIRDDGSVKVFGYSAYHNWFKSDKRIKKRDVTKKKIDLMCNICSKNRVFLNLTLKLQNFRL